MCVCKQVQALTQRELLLRRKSNAYIPIIILYFINLFLLGIVQVSSKVPVNGLRDSMAGFLDPTALRRKELLPVRVFTERSPYSFF